MPKNLKKQSGFVVIMGMLMLVLGAAFWFGTVSSLRSEAMQIETRQEHVRELHRIKDRMLTYAVMQPEVFRTDSGSNIPRNQEDIPGPGYFPCPDKTGDGNSNAPCTAIGDWDGDGDANEHDGFVIGLVPESTNTRFFTFIDKPKERNRYWYAVDERFLTQNSAFNFSGTPSRFVPLNSTTPDLTIATGSPAITLDGLDDIIMVLIYAGQPLEGQRHSKVLVTNIVDSIGNYLELENATVDGRFISSVKGSTTNNATADDFNDYVITVTRREWNAAMLSRVARDVLNLVDATGTGFWSDVDSDGEVSLADFDADADGTVRRDEIEGDGSPDLCDLLERGVTGDMHWFNDCLYTGGAAPDFAPTCTQNSTNTNENPFGQGWATELGC